MRAPSLAPARPGTTRAEAPPVAAVPDLDARDVEGRRRGHAYEQARLRVRPRRDAQAGEAELQGVRHVRPARGRGRGEERERERGGEEPGRAGHTSGDPTSPAS